MSGAPTSPMQHDKRKKTKISISEILARDSEGEPALSTGRNTSTTTSTTSLHQHGHARVGPIDFTPKRSSSINDRHSRQRGLMRTSSKGEISRNQKEKPLRRNKSQPPAFFGSALDTQPIEPRSLSARSHDSTSLSARSLDSHRSHESKAPPRPRDLQDLQDLRNMQDLLELQELQGLQGGSTASTSALSSPVDRNRASPIPIRATSHTLTGSKPRTNSLSGASFTNVGQGSGSSAIRTHARHASFDANGTHHDAGDASPLTSPSSRSPVSTPPYLRRPPPQRYPSQQSLAPPPASVDAVFSPREMQLQVNPFSPRSPPPPSISPTTYRSQSPASANSRSAPQSPSFLSHSPSLPGTHSPSVRISSDPSSSEFETSSHSSASSGSYSPRSSSSAGNSPSVTPRSSPSPSPQSSPRSSSQGSFSNAQIPQLQLPNDTNEGAAETPPRKSSTSSPRTHPRKSSSPRPPNSSPKRNTRKSSNSSVPIPLSLQDSPSSPTPSSNPLSPSPSISSASSSTSVRVPALSLATLSHTHSLPTSPVNAPLPLSYRHSTSILEQIAPHNRPSLEIGGELYIATSPYKITNIDTSNNNTTTTTTTTSTNSNTTVNNTNSSPETSSNSNGNRSRSGSKAIGDNDSQFSVKFVVQEKRDEILKRMFLSLDDKNSVVSGTPEELIDNVLKESFIGAGMIEYMEDILLTYRYFLPSAHALLEHLITRYTQPPSATQGQLEPSVAEYKRWKSSAQLRIINVIKKWLEHHFSDFKADVSLLQSVLDFVDRDVIASENHIWGQNLRDVIQSRLLEFIEGGDTETFSSLNLPSSKMAPSLLVALLKQSGVVGDRRKLLARYKQAFLATDAVRWMVTALKMTGEEEAVGLMNKMIETGHVQHVSNPQKAFKNSPQSMYRILDPSKMSSPKGDTKLRVHPEPILPRGGIKNITFADVDPLEIARQLTLIEFRMYRKIELSELTSQVWNKGGGANVVKMIERANEVSYWVATEIVLTPNMKERVNVLKKFITIADHCKSFNNWNTLMEIMIGLNLGCVQRLKKTWAGLAKKEAHIFGELSTATNSLGNYKVYRASIAADTTPFLPYLAVFLRDLTFIEDGNKDYISEGVINFAKMKMLAHVFRQVLKFQRSVYFFSDVPVLQKVLSTDLFVMRQDRELYKYSNSCEPPQKSYAARLTLNMSDLPYLQSIASDPPSPRDGGGGAGRMDQIKRSGSVLSETGSLVSDSGSESGSRIGFGRARSETGHSDLADSRSRSGTIGSVVDQEK